ncbi:MAG: formate dehydrogenase accessory sulfurtransferase FdhD [Sandaracinaceae bacterium]|nr:formate dehydrogenase accessory sulfurtransferase FdhD [Sandaracinaceae bacterium]
MDGPAVTRREVLRDPDGGPAEADAVAVEEPLEIRVGGEPLVITMRTPGEDRFLAVGLLFAEGVLESLADVGTVAHCGRAGDEGFENVIDLTAGPGVALDASRLEGTRRGTLTTASCGVCGRRSIDDLLARIGPLDHARKVPRAIARAAPEILARSQDAFPRTGGVHAAAALTADGALLAAAEDVGRHNAVDKVVGKLLYAGTLTDAALLVVSGRVSFEIVQKAAAARVGVVVAVSAPTSLAIDLARRASMALVAFARDGRMNVYAGAERLE